VADIIWSLPASELWQILGRLGNYMYVVQLSESALNFLYPEQGVSKLPWNVGSCLSINMSCYLWRLASWCVIFKYSWFMWCDAASLGNSRRESITFICKCLRSLKEDEGNTSLRHVGNIPVAEGHMAEYWNPTWHCQSKLETWVWCIFYIVWFK
jgi:hypothetical protein